MSQSQYTKEEIEDYRQVFALFDTDGSGAIGNDELGDAMRQFGMNPTERELENLVNEVDADGNGEIDFDEFCTVLKKMTSKRETDEEIIRQCFTVFDQDKNGVISDAEFRHVFKDIGGFTEDVIEEIFQETDVDGNGSIDYEEFTQLVRTYLLDGDEEHLDELGSNVSSSESRNKKNKSPADGAGAKESAIRHS